MDENWKFAYKAGAECNGVEGHPWPPAYPFCQTNFRIFRAEHMMDTNGERFGADSVHKSSDHLLDSTAKKKGRPDAKVARLKIR